MTIYAFVNGLAGAFAPTIISSLGVAVGGPSLFFGFVIATVTGFILQFGKRTESGQLLQPTTINEKE